MTSARLALFLAAESFDAARQALERIGAYKTKVSELEPLGFDPVDSRNVTIIACPEVVSRLAPNAGVALTDLDPGIRDCTVVTGWCLEARGVVRDGIVLLRNFGGEPDSDPIEHQANPLGPLQSGGESVASRMVR